MLNKFTHLHLHTHYSLLDGLSKVDELMVRIKELGMDSVAITDHGNMYGAIEFYKGARANGIKPIIGCEVYVAENKMTDRNKDDGIYHLVLLAKNKRGYQNLIKLISEANLNGFYYKPRIDKELLKEHSDGLICLSGCLSGELSRNIKNKNIEKAEKVAKWYKRLFGEDYYIEIQRHPNIKDQVKVTKELIELAKKLEIPMVATADSHYLRHEDAHTHDILLAIQTKKEASDDERLSLKEDDFSVRSPEEMTELFKDLPEAIENTQKVLEKCNLDLEFGVIQLPHFDIPEGYDADSYLKKICLENLPKKYIASDVNPGKRLEYELSVIQKTGFASYLLIVADIINWAKNNGVAVGPGRGSAAGSIICYLLGITNIEPIRHGLLFERFMNPDRISMPDIDMDFDEERRGMVLDYINQKYGSDRVAQIITFGTMAARSSIRDAGRAMGCDLKLCDKVAKMIPFSMTIEESLQVVDELKKEYENLESKKLIDTAIGLEGVVRHIGTHACGIVISKEKITKNMPVQMSSKKDGSIMSQYSMKPIEDLGMLKMDFLGLMNLTIIRKALELIKERYGININIDNIPIHDNRTFNLLREAKTTSVFQLESDGMKRYLKELKPTEFNDITAMISLYRPGPMELIPEYITRKHGIKPVEYLHPSLEPILKDTYGIMIYQEQLMAAVRALAGFTLAEADILRKAIGKKIKSLLDEQEGKFKDGAKAKGISSKVANEFWSLVEPFNRYAFNKSHGVSYATIAYQTAYLKAHYPVEFMTAVMNCDSDTVDRISLLIQEVRSIGIDILPPDVNKSSVGFTVNGNEIRFGLSRIKGIGEEVIRKIVTEREIGREFKSVSDFIRRVSHKSINKRVLEAMVKSGAFDSIEKRSVMMACVEQILSYGKMDEKELLPTLVLANISKDIDTNQKLSWEKELLGLFVSEHPMSRYKEEVRKDKRIIDISEVKNKTGGYIVVGGIVSSTRKLITKKGKAMMFCGLEDESGKIDVVVFPTLYERVKDILSENNIVSIGGKVESSDRGNKLICMGANLVASLP